MAGNSCEEPSPWCQPIGLSNFRWWNHYCTLSVSARKTGWELEVSESICCMGTGELSAAPCCGRSPLKLCKCHDPATSLPNKASPQNLTASDFWRATKNLPWLLQCLHHCSLPAASSQRRLSMQLSRDMERCTASSALLHSQLHRCS